jgi:hypothetical protein
MELVVFGCSSLLHLLILGKAVVASCLQEHATTGRLPEAGCRQLPTATKISRTA